jgi:hypothetical protein
MPLSVRIVALLLIFATRVCRGENGGGEALPKLNRYTPLGGIHPRGEGYSGIYPGFDGGSAVLLSEIALAAGTLDVAVPALAFKASPPGRAGRARRPSLLLRHGRFPNQVTKTLDGIAAIEFLAAEAVCGDDQHAFAADALAAQHAQAIEYRGMQRYRSRDVEAELHGGRDLVDVLATRAGSADEGKLDLALVERDAGGNDYHAPSVRGGASTHNQPCRTDIR